MQPDLQNNYDSDDESIFSETTYKTTFDMNNAFIEEVTLESQGKPIDVKFSLKFDDGPLDLDPDLLSNVLGRLEFKEPTTIQKYTIPLIRRGCDVMACAHTGTGKTAAFLIPIVQAIHGINPKVVTGKIQKPLALIVAPTRELALQIFHETKKFTFKLKSCRPKIAYGGVDFNDQATGLWLGCNILIGTPGRIRHYIEEGKVSLENIKYFVLDEADRMLDMGFKGAMYYLTDKVTGMPDKSVRQTILFSATYTKGVLEVSNDFLKKTHCFVGVGKIDTKAAKGSVGTAPPNIIQTFHNLTADQKKHRLREILNVLMLADAETAIEEYERQRKNRRPDSDEYMDHVFQRGFRNKGIVFVRTKKDAHALTGFLCEYLTETCFGVFRRKYPKYGGGFSDLSYDLCDTINGDVPQAWREKRLNEFKSGNQYLVLVATNIASRGLDIKDLTHVIQYHLPGNIEEYIHRIGRTGRAGKSGTAISFYQPDTDRGMAVKLVRVMQESGQEMPEWLLAEAGLRK